MIRSVRSAARPQWGQQVGAASFIVNGGSTITVPTGRGITHARVRMIGPGGDGKYYNTGGQSTFNGGGGGAFVMAVFGVTAGESLTVELANASTHYAVALKRSSAYLARAAGGRHYTGSEAAVQALGGQVADCIGDLIREGGRSGYIAYASGDYRYQSPELVSARGGPVRSSQNYAGGYPAGDGDFFAAYLAGMRSDWGHYLYRLNPDTGQNDTMPGFGGCFDLTAGRPGKIHVEYFDAYPGPAI